MSFFRKNKTCDIYRLTRTGDADTYGASPIYTSIDMGVFPAGNNILAVYPGELSFQLYEIYIHDYVSLQNGDKFVETTTGEVWILRGVPRIYDSARNYYLQCIGEMQVGS